MAWRLTPLPVTLIFISVLTSGLNVRANDSGLHLDVSYKTEANTQSDFLVIKCSLDTSMTNMGTVATLSLFGSKPYGSKDEFDQLAIIDMWSNAPKLAGGVEDTDVLVSGEISSDLSGKSILVLSWSSITNLYRHSYKCVANGISKDGQAASVSTVVKVEIIGGGSCQISDSIHSELHRVSTMTQLTANTTEDMSQQIASLNRKVDGLEAKIESFHLATRLHSTLLAIDKSKFDIGLSGVAKGRVYLASKQITAFDLEGANKACQASNGYLLELDNDEETQIVLDLVNEVGGTTHFALGGTDRAKEGHFIYFNSKKPIPQHLTWRNGQPNDHGGNEDCMEIYVPVQGLNDIPCNSAVKYLCEVPLSF